MDIIETDRLVLRPFEDRDAEDLYAYAKDPRVGGAAGWRPHASAAESRDSIKGLFSSENIAALELRETGRVIGDAGFFGRHPNGYDPKHPDDELGYDLHHDFWGRGLMTEASKALIRWGFERRGFERIWCGCSQDNARSRGVIENCGFCFAFGRTEKNGRKTLMFVLSEEGWRGRISGASQGG